MSETLFPTFRKIRKTPMRDLLRGRLTGRLDWRAAIADAGFSSDVAALIVQTVKQTRLWRIEKAAVARELIAHFQDGHATGKTSAELVDRFGEIKSAAKLIRRAKRRGRPIVWHIWNVTFRITCAMLAIYAALLIRFFVGRPNPKIDYVARLNEMVLKTLDTNRAWPVWEEAILAASDGFKDGYPQFSDSIGMGRETPAWSQTVDWLNQHAQALRLARQAGQLPSLGFVYGPGGSQDDPRLFPNRVHRDMQDKDQPLIALLLPHLNFARSMATILSLDARRATELSDGNRAATDLTAILGLARQLRTSDGSMITSLVYIGIDALANGRMQHILLEHPDLWSDQQLIAFAHLFAGPNVAADLTSVDTERSFFYDMIQRIYTDDGHGDGRLTPKGLQLMAGVGPVRGSDGSSPDRLIPALVAPLPIVIASRAEMVGEYDHLMNETEANFHQPLRQADWEKTITQLRSIKDSPIQSSRYLLVSVMAPSFNKCQATCERYLGTRDGTLVAISLELYRRRNGKYPATLTQLTPELLPQIPADRITGEPIKYLLIEGKPVVYSVGGDRIDNGGKRPQKLPNSSNSPAVWGNPADAPRGDWVLYPPDPDDSDH